MNRRYSEDELWLVHLRKFHATGSGDLERHLRAVLGGMLISDAVHCGVESIEATVTDEGWIFLGCDQEWLQLNLSEAITSRELFGQLIYWPGDTQRTRHEFHLATVASDVFLGRSGAFEAIKGSLPPATTLEMARRYVFVLGYRLPHRGTRDGTSSSAP